MVILEIPTNPNCAAVDTRVFHDLEPARAVSRVRLEPQTGASAEWCDVTGWTAVGAPCPAVIRKVDDSGEGVAFLLSGGDGGLRLRPSIEPAPWDLGNARQWGEPFLILPDTRDIQFAEGGGRDG